MLVPGQRQPLAPAAAPSPAAGAVAVRLASNSHFLLERINHRSSHVRLLPSPGISQCIYTPSGIPEAMHTAIDILAPSVCVDTCSVLATGLAAGIAAFVAGSRLFTTGSSVHSPRWWLGLCWAAAFCLGVCTHAAVSIGLVEGGFDSRSKFVQGDSFATLPSLAPLLVAVHHQVGEFHCCLPEQSQHLRHQCQNFICQPCPHAAGWHHNAAYLVVVGLGLPAVMALLWAAGGFRLRSRYVGAVVTLYVIISLLLVALRSA